MEIEGSPLKSPSICIRFRDLSYKKGVRMASFKEQGPVERFEKRKLYRFPVQLPVVLGHFVDDMSSICTNLSTDGVSVETSLALAIGERLTLSVVLAPKEEPLRMVGQVVWKREMGAVDIEEQALHEVGIRFLRPLPSMERQNEDFGAYEPRSGESAGYLLPRR